VNSNGFANLKDCPGWRPTKDRYKVRPQDAPFRQELPPEFREVIVPHRVGRVVIQTNCDRTGDPCGYCDVPTRRVPVTVSSRSSVVTGMRKAPLSLLLHQTSKLMQLDVVEIGYCPIVHA
jgi:hypothetical protein